MQHIILQTQIFISSVFTECFEHKYNIQRIRGFYLHIKFLWKMFTIYTERL